MSPLVLLCLALADDPEAAFRRGVEHLEARENDKAEAEFTRAIAGDPKSWAAYDRRGDARLKQGKFTDAVADFDAALERQPRLGPDHWRRGIALYYAGRHLDGAKQFESHKTVNPEDVENAAWHYLCNAKVVGKEKARGELITVTKDRRVPMAEIQKLFAGKLTAADVLAKAEATDAATDAGTEARFYAHLYVALWHEAEGDAKATKEHLTAAVGKYKIGHYMWDVADAHLAALGKKK